MRFLRSLAAIVTPHGRPGAVARAALVAVTGAGLVALWCRGVGTLPGPRAVAAALARLWRERGLYDHLAASVALNLRALAWSTALGLTIAYLAVVPAVQPLAHALTKLRFSGLVGWGFVLAVAAGDGRTLELWMLVFGMTPFLATAMIAVVMAVPRERLDHARSLGLGPWRTVGEVVVRGTAADALEAIRQNAAMGWMMLTAVEGVARAGGGLGVLMLDAEKHLDLAAVFAVIAVVLAVGVVQDRVLVALRRALCPYAELPVTPA